MCKLLFPLLILPFLAHGQMCLTVKETYTGEPMTTSAAYFEQSETVTDTSLFFNKGNNKISLGFNFLSDMKPSDFDVQNILLLVKFANGETKKFYTKGLTKLLGYHDQILVMFYSAITEDDIEYFSKNPVTSLRFCYNGDEAIGIDVDVYKRRSKRILAAAKCIL